MYSIRPGYILGFHGCDKSVADQIISQQLSGLKFSSNDWDWLGTGAYFWENNSERALNWAKDEARRPRSKIKKPAVLGAVISLGHCLDLLDSANIRLVSEAYEHLKEISNLAEKPLPVNRDVSGTSGNDRLIRHLDCAVINIVHQKALEVKIDFDSVRGMFIEGMPLYELAGFREKNHIQICIRNPNCIKGYFVPRTLDRSYKRI